VKNWYCKFINHKWEFDGGSWIVKDVSVTVRKCKRCGLRQAIEHYHIIPNYQPGEVGRGVSTLRWEKKPGDPGYNEVFERNERPTK